MFKRDYIRCLNHDRSVERPAGSINPLSARYSLRFNSVISTGAGLLLMLSCTTNLGEEEEDCNVRAARSNSAIASVRIVVSIFFSKFADLDRLHAY
jgi:hypothetical protein